MNKILIVGSKGFIGSNFEKYLNILAGVEVWGCDVVTDYGAFNYFLIDASNSDFEELFQAHSFDICINFSGSASVPDSLLHPLRDFYLNSLNVFKMVEAIRKYRPACKFLNISSAAVYGNPEQLPIKESDVLKPISPYGYHKLQSENICEEYNRFYNIQTCSVRIFSAYGNGLKKQLFWDISQKLSKNNQVTLYGTGLESRDFIHIDDIVKAIELIAMKGDFNASHYNIANGEEITIKDAAEKLQSFLSLQNVVSFAGDYRKGDPLNWRADINKLKALGYQQMVTIDQGLNKYAQWLQEEKLV